MFCRHNAYFYNAVSTRVNAMTPEEKARQEIDRLLEAAGWQIQDYRNLNLGATLGVAIREFPLESGRSDYLWVRNILEGKWED